jgi:hypothetical protein
MVLGAEEFTATTDAAGMAEFVITQQTLGNLGPGTHEATFTAHRTGMSDFVFHEMIMVPR